MKKLRDIIIGLVMCALGIFILGASIFEEATSTIKGLAILGLVVHIILFQRCFNELCNITNNNDKD